jgi:hypothetical protein
MKRRDILIAGFLAVLIVLPLASAGIFDFLTGKVTASQTNVTIPVGNTPPVITSVSYPATVDPVEANQRTVYISFIAYDHDCYPGYNDINTATGTFSITNPGETTKSGSCSYVTNISLKESNFSCTFNMDYWDEAASWNINVTIADNSAAYYSNDGSSFTYNSLTAFVMAPTSMTYATLYPGNTSNKATNNPLNLNNTGNYVVTSGNIQLNATIITGESDPSSKIASDLFNVSLADNCAGTTLANSTFVNITGSTLPRGNISLGVSREDLYHCLTLVPAYITKQTYSTTAEGAWTVKII